MSISVNIFLNIKNINFQYSFQCRTSNVSVNLKLVIMCSLGLCLCCKHGSYRTRIVRMDICLSLLNMVGSYERNWYFLSCSEHDYMYIICYITTTSVLVFCNYLYNLKDTRHKYLMVNGEYIVRSLSGSHKSIEEFCLDYDISKNI